MGKKKKYNNLYSELFLCMAIVVKMTMQHLCIISLFDRGYGESLLGRVCYQGSYL